MLNPHRIVSFITIVLLFVFYFLFGATPHFYLSTGLLIVLYLSVEFFGAYFIGLNFHLPSLNYLDKNKSQIALTFDDGPVDPQTSSVLDVLKKHDVKATFFVIGKNIPGNESVLKRMIQEGHKIGSHTYSHDYWIDVWGRKKLEADIKLSYDLIENATGTETTLFRPPYGVTNPVFAYVLKKLELYSIGWNVRSYDTSTPDINKVLQRVLSKTKKGSIILLHDRLDQMPDLLEKLIPALRQKGFEFVTIDENYKSK
jgi:peptidoglycan-N-acetylglucosamine deacetylase